MAAKKILLMATVAMLGTGLGFIATGPAKTTTGTCTSSCSKTGKDIIPAGTVNDITDCNDIYNNGMNLVFNCTLY